MTTASYLKTVIKIKTIMWQKKLSPNRSNVNNKQKRFSLAFLKASISRKLTITVPRKKT